MADAEALASGVTLQIQALYVTVHCSLTALVPLPKQRWLPSPPPSSTTSCASAAAASASRGIVTGWTGGGHRITRAHDARPRTGRLLGEILRGEGGKEAAGEVVAHSCSSTCLAILLGRREDLGSGGEEGHAPAKREAGVEEGAAVEEAEVAVVLPPGRREGRTSPSQ